jgi:hypothetical protein
MNNNKYTRLLNSCLSFSHLKSASVGRNVGLVYTVITGTKDYSDKCWFPLNPATVLRRLYRVFVCELTRKLIDKRKFRALQRRT